MDDRLKQVQTTDLTDSRLNHEFVAWLKTSGMNYLLMLLLVACAFLAWDWWNRSRMKRATRPGPNSPPPRVPPPFAASPTPMRKSMPSRNSRC